MKKKPIYLWVLLILSALISVPSLFGIVSPLPSKEALRAVQKQVAGVSAQQLEDQLNYNYRVAEASHSIFNMALIVLSAILVVVAIVFLVRKNLQYANFDNEYWFKSCQHFLYRHQCSLLSPCLL